ncbi:MAG: response regulator, partial [bacterium]
ICLEKEGHEVKVAKTGVEATEMAFDEPWDLIILDLKLPKMNGFMVAETLKDDKKTKDIPIIVTSALAEETDIKKAKKLGVNEYLVKPVSTKKLLETVAANIKEEKQ